MNSLSSTHVSAFQMLRNSTFSHVSLSRRKKNRRISQHDSSDEEKESVLKLTDWEKHDKKREILTTISEAKITLKKRIEGEDIVEEMKFKRKHKSYLPDINSTKLLPIIKTIRQRQANKEIEEVFKEKCRYFQMFEKDLADTYEKLEKELEKVRVDREILREDCCEIKKKVPLFVQELEKLKESLVVFEEKGRKGTSQIDLTGWMKNRDKLRENIKEKEKEKPLIVKSVNEELESKESKLSELDELNKTIRKKLEIVKSTQIKHYLSLLKDGKDTRSEGIQWIVIKLWKLGESVKVHQFPAFLDDDSVHFILFVSQKSLEIEVLLNKISPAKKVFSADKPNRWNNIKKRLAELTKQIKADRPEYIYNNKRVSIRWVPNHVNDSVSLEKTVIEPSFYENYIGKVKDMIKTALNNEVHRITLEYLLHGYEERFKVGIKDVISAIVGIDSIDKHLAAVSKHKRDLSRILEGRRTFNF